MEITLHYFSGTVPQAGKHYAFNILTWRGQQQNRTGWTQSLAGLRDKQSTWWWGSLGSIHHWIFMFRKFHGESYNMNANTQIISVVKSVSFPTIVGAASAETIKLIPVCPSDVSFWLVINYYAQCIHRRTRNLTKDRFQINTLWVSYFKDVYFGVNHTPSNTIQHIEKFSTITDSKYRSKYGKCE